MKKWIDRTLIIFFCLAIACGCGVVLYKHVSNFSAWLTGAKPTAEFKKDLTAAVPAKAQMNAMYNMIQKNLLLKKEAGNFTYYLNFDGGYIVVEAKKSDAGITAAQKNVKALYDKAASLKADFLYVNLPSRANAAYQAMLQGIDFDQPNKNKLLAGLGEIPILDMRDDDYFSNVNPYYKTDHHWTLDAAFHTFGATINTLNALFSLNLNTAFADVSNYRRIINPACFSGSIRTNLTQVCLDKEDFSLLLPIDQTDFTFEHFSKQKGDIKKEGSFETALLDMSKYDDPSYVNKYNVFLSAAYVETHIVNHTADNNKKLLLISSSYGRAFAPYISRCFAETVYLDPQVGRYNDSITAYMEQYKPDVVVVLHDDYVLANVD